MKLNLPSKTECYRPSKQGLAVSLESNGTLAQDVSIDFPGQNYRSSPKYMLSFPLRGLILPLILKASLSAQVDPVNGTVTSDTVDEPGLGYEVARGSLLKEVLTLLD